MYKRHSKKYDFLHRALTYSIMAIAVIAGVIICLFLAMGYRFDFNSGKISQVALLQFRSIPNKADVTVNDELLPASTPTRLNVPAGKNNVKISLDGYRSWKKTVDVSSGQVLWLDYVRLIPTSITTEVVQSFADMQDILLSPDKHWLFLQSSTGFMLADISDPESVRFSTFIIPDDLLIKPNADQEEQFAMIEWDSSSRYLLIRHSVGENVEFLRLDRQNPEKIINLNTEFKQPISKLNFAPNKTDEFYGITNNTLNIFLHKDHSTVGQIVDYIVSDYSLSSDGKIAFIGSDTVNAAENNQIIGVYHNNTTTDIKTFDQSAPTFVEMARFNDQDYLVIARDETVTIYKDPIKQSTSEPIYLSSPSGIDWLSLSPTDRFVIAGNDGKIVGYDLDVKDNFSFETSYTEAPSWLDNTHLVVTNKSQIQIMDFDGTNAENIVSGLDMAVLSSDGEFLFSLDKTNDGVVLQRSKLVIED
ncbi:MAG: PEGA domain-containing protein [Candidatus Nomurabacteria bacterium]|jgi:hypothetical protein|nr:PEGA domain-containing protein [Candidatus Nomurabacteria bacterium]